MDDKTNTAKELDVLIETLRSSIQKIDTTSFNEDEIVRGLVSILKNNMAAAAKIIENLDSGRLPSYYAEVEAIAKEQKNQEINRRTVILDFPSISNANKDDEKSARINLANHLARALTQGLLEIPDAFQNMSTALLSIQLLLTNVLIQRVPYEAAIAFMDDIYKNINHILEQQTPAHIKKKITPTIQ